MALHVLILIITMIFNANDFIRCNYLNHLKGSRKSGLLNNINYYLLHALFFFPALVKMFLFIRQQCAHDCINTAALSAWPQQPSSPFSQRTTCPQTDRHCGDVSQFAVGSFPFADQGNTDWLTSWPPFNTPLCRALVPQLPLVMKTGTWTTWIITNTISMTTTTQTRISSSPRHPVRTYGRNLNWYQPRPRPPSGQ